MRRILVRGALGVPLILILIVALAWVAQRRLIYFPDRGVPQAAAQASDVTLRTADGLRLDAWLIRPPSGTPDLRVSVLVAPGNAGNRHGRLPLGTALAGLGLTVLLLEYRGYGGNPGRPTESGLARDADAACDYLAERVGFPVLYYGESLGAAVVTALAVRRPPVGLVLRSPFADLAAAGREHYPLLPVRQLLRDRFPVLSLIPRVPVPTVVVYGTADRTVPPSQSAAVAGAAPDLRLELPIPGADHNDPSLVAGPHLRSALLPLLPP
ncbi:alpha/beta hydrolase [Actinoplanes sp. GCM10030250]|uniref:alpha/beta hydrolase n=1 Tax=Actinoplanes sp. GCM10030250 TaxID=3273376 RepID=UPI00360D7676